MAEWIVIARPTDLAEWEERVIVTVLKRLSIYARTTAAQVRALARRS
jgi:hypothetical protein